MMQEDRIAGPSRPPQLPAATESPMPPQDLLRDVTSLSESSSGSSLWNQITENNPYFSAGAGLMVLGVALTSFRRATTLGATFAQRRLLVTLEITSKDRSYPWFLEWMASQAPQAVAVPPTTVRGRPTSKSTPSSTDVARQSAPKARKSWLDRLPPIRSHQLAVETTYKQHENGHTEALFSLVPGPGTHYFRYKGAWMQVTRERDAKLMDLHSGSPWETITLTTLSRDRGLFPQLLAEARSLAVQGQEGKTVVYTAWGLEWRPFGKPRRKRETNSVVLAEGVSERIEADLRRFLSRGKWYAERGIPYRRGYLLHGPPGSGKTSYIQSLAGALNYNICLLNLSERGLTDDKLNHLLALAPERSFILLEDIDAAFNKRVQTSEDGYKSAVTFSGLLNALDGVTSAEERIIFMTTNHFDRLDPALVRPGRVDLKEMLDDAVPEQAERLFVRFYGQQDTTRNRADHRISSTSDSSASTKEDESSSATNQEDIVRLGSHLRHIVQEQMNHGRRVSMAALQGHFIRHGAADSLETIQALFVDKARADAETRS